MPNNQPQPTSFKRYLSIVQLASWIVCHIWLVLLLKNFDIRPSHIEMMAFGLGMQLVGLLLYTWKGEIRYFWAICSIVSASCLYLMYHVNVDDESANFLSTLNKFIYAFLIAQIAYFCTIISILRDVLDDPQ